MSDTIRTTDAALAEFGAWALAKSREDLGDLDGGDLQDKAEELGLLIRVPVEKPCGEFCRCAEYADEWPWTCLRLSDEAHARCAMYAGN